MMVDGEQCSVWSEEVVISSSHLACGDGYCLASLSMHPCHPWFDCLGPQCGVLRAFKVEMKDHFLDFLYIRAV